MFDHVPVGCCIKHVIVVFVGGVVLNVWIQSFVVAIPTCKTPFLREHVEWILRRWTLYKKYLPIFEIFTTFETVVTS